MEKILGYSFVCITVVSMFFCVMAGFVLNDRDKYRTPSYRGKRNRRTR